MTGKLRLLGLLVLVGPLGGCVGAMVGNAAGAVVGTAVSTTIEVAKVPFKVGGAVIDVAREDEND